MVTKKKTKEDVGSTQLGIVLQKRLVDMGSNMMRMSADIGKAYDYCRRICKGLNHPGADTLKKICDYTSLDFDEMWQLVNADKAFEKAVDSGLLEMISDDTDSILLKIKMKWGMLSENDKLEVLDFVQLRTDLIQLRAERAIKHARLRTRSNSHATV